VAGLREELRRQVDERPTPVRVETRVRRSRLVMFSRVCAAHLAEAPISDTQADGALASRDLDAVDANDDADGSEWAAVTLRFAAVEAARILLSFGGDVVVLFPPEVRDDLGPPRLGDR
jgi:hypothetical protein